MTQFKMNKVTENYWLIYAVWDIIFSHRVNLKLAHRFHALLIVKILSLQRAIPEVPYLKLLDEESYLSLDDWFMVQQSCMDLTKV